MAPSLSEPRRRRASASGGRGRILVKNYPPQNIRNIALVGHHAVGKTMLTEHLLYTAGAIERVGSVESGTTQSDYDPIEVRRHISMSASVLPLEWAGCKINLVDVPGTPDFVAEMYAAARAVEAFVIVCEAKPRLDVGFDLAWRIAEEHGLARCVFVNKLEREKADYDGLLSELDRRYGRRIVGVQIPIGSQSAFSGILDLLAMKVYRGKDRGVEIEDAPSDYALEAATRREKMMDAAAESDDELAMKYLDGQELSADEIEHGLLLGIERGKAVPVMVGSAASGLGVATLLDRIVHEMPSPADAPKAGDGRSVFAMGQDAPPPALSADAPPTALCFKTLNDPFVGKVSYLRVLDGSLKADAMLRHGRTGASERLHHLLIPHGKTLEPTTGVGPGDIAVVAKLGDLRTGDALCAPEASDCPPPVRLPEPTFRLAISAATKGDEDKLGAALERLVEEDPALRVSYDHSTHETILAGMGDIHLDAALERLRVRSGVKVESKPASVPFLETIRKSAKAQGRHKRQTGGKGQFGDCWIEISPLPRGSGFEFENKVVGGAIPKNYIPAIEKGLREEMTRGLAAGHPMTDFKAVVYDGSYHDVDSNEAAFKTAAALALRAASESASPVVLEPIMRITVHAPDDAVGDVVGDLNSRKGRLHGLEPHAPGETRIEASVPMANLATYALDLRGVTKGRGEFTLALEGYEEAPHLSAGGKG